MVDKSNFPSLAEIEQEDRFSKLSYEEQKALRANWLDLYTKEVDPAINSLDNNTYKKIIDDIVNAPPVFEGNLSQYGLEKSVLAEAVKRKDPVAKWQVFADIWGDSWFGRIGIARWLLEMTGSALEAVNVDAFNEALRLFYPQTPDDEKARAYFMETALKDPDIKGTAKFANVGGAIAGTLTDIAIGRLMTAPLWTQVTKNVLTPLTTSLVGKTKFSRWLIQSATPEMIRNSRDGVIGVVSEYLNDAFNQRNIASMEFPEQAKWAASTFGEYWLADMLMYGVLSSFKAAGKAVFKVYGNKVVPKLNAPIEDPQAMDNFIKTLMNGGELDPKLWSQLPDSAREQFVRLQARNVVLKNISKGEVPSVDDLNTWVAQSKGWDLVKENGVWKATKIVTDGMVEPTTLKGAYSSSSDALKAAFKFDTSLTDFTPTLDASVAKTNLQVRKVVTSKVDKAIIRDKINPDAVSLALEPTSAGVVQIDKVNKYLENFSVGEGLSTPIRAVYVPSEKYFAAKGKYPLDTVGAIPIPKQITPEQRKEFTKYFVDSIVEKLPKESKLRGVTGAQIVDQLSQIEHGYSPEILKANIQKLFPNSQLRQNGEGFTLILNGQKIDFPDTVSLGKFVFANQPPGEIVGQLKEYAAKRLALHIEELDSGGFVVRQRGKILVTADTEADLIHEMYSKGWVPNLPDTLAPNVVQIDPFANTIRTTKTVMVGNARHIADELSKFTDLRKEAKKQIVSYLPKDKVKEAVVTTVDSYLELVDPDLNITKRFKNREELVKYLRKSTDSIEKLEEIANLKGLFVAPVNGGWVVRDSLNPNSTLKTVSSLAELRNVIKQASPTPQIGKELTSLDDAFIKQLFKGNEDLYFEMQGITPTMTSSFSAFDIDKAVKLKVSEGRVKASTTLASFYRPMDVVAQKVANDLGNPEIYKSWDDVRRANTVATGFSRKAAALIDSIVKPLNKDEMKVGLLMLESSPDKWAEILAKNKITNPRKELFDAVNEMRKMYDEAKDVFNINPMVWMTNYAPRIRKFFLDPDNLKKLDPSESALRALSASAEFTNNMPKEVKFFTRNLRVSEMVEWAENANMRDTAIRYFQTGYKSKILQEPYEKFRQMIMKDIYPKDRETALRFVRYGEQIMGMDLDLEGAMLKKASVQASTELFQRLSKALHSPGLSKKQVDDVVSLLNGLMVTSTMAFRPTLVARNMVQPLLTVAPRIGVTPVVRAIAKSTELGAEEVTKILRDLGELMEEAPFLANVEARLPLEKLAKAGMKGYKNADSWNRVVTYLAASDQMDDAIKRWNKIDPKTNLRYIDEKQFLSLSGIDCLSPQDQKLILDTLKTQGAEAAKVKFATKLIYETQFPYQNSENPILFHGFWGRLFGGFGTYGVFYLENLKRGLTNAGPMGAVKFAGRLALTTAAAHVTFEKFFGMSADAFMPWNQATFDGGPFYKLFNRSLTALQSGYEGKEARAGLLKEWGRLLVPGSVQMKSIVDAFDAANRGEMHEALVRLLGASYVGK